MSEPITIERVERALALCALLVVRDGLAAMRGQQATVERAKALLESLGSPMQRNLLLPGATTAPPSGP